MFGLISFEILDSDEEAEFVSKCMKDIGDINIKDIQDI